MPADFPSFRMLFHELAPCAEDAYHKVLLPWIPKAREAMSVLGRYGGLEAIHWRKDTPDDLCSGGDTSYYSCLERLYALSRVSDLLLTPFEPVPREALAVGYDENWQPSAVISAEERQAWWTALGMTPIDETRAFHPFYHEIVTVEQADDPQEPIALTGTLWTGFMLGKLMFCRAGVSVRGGRAHIVKEIAETSRIYWTFLRNNRQAVDLSHGWGHNSQWSTDFRRDYAAEDAYHYNVDGEHPLIETDGAGGSERGWGELSVDSSIELMSNRCFVRTTEHLYDEALYSAFYSEPRTS